MSEIKQVRIVVFKLMLGENNTKAYREVILITVIGFPIINYILQSLWKLITSLIQKCLIVGKNLNALGIYRATVRG